MGRPRSAKRDEAAKLWLLSKKRCALNEIAEKLGVSVSQIRKWKCEDKWSSLKLLNVSGALVITATKKSGGQPNNKNAIGAGAPVGNKNAVTTGEFESIFFDTLTADERKLIDNITLEKRTLLFNEIQLMTVRERKMLKRLNEFKETEVSGTEITMQTDTGVVVVKTKKRPPVTVLLAIEDALTKIQAQKRQAIDLLDKIERGEAEVW